MSKHHALPALARALKTLKQANDDAVAQQIEQGKQQEGKRRRQGQIRPRHQHRQPHAEQPQQAGQRPRDRKRRKPG